MGYFSNLMSTHVRQRLWTQPLKLLLFYFIFILATVAPKQKRKGLILEIKAPSTRIGISLNPQLFLSGF